PVLAPDLSDEESFPVGARRMIEVDKVDVLVGCLSSGSRKQVAGVCESGGILLFYPMNFEGLEASPNVVYLGGGPNQQLLPMIQWAVGFLKRRKFYLIGAENLFSRATQEVFKGALEEQHLEPVGLRSLRPDQVVDDFIPIVREIQAAGADIVIDTLSPEL